MTFIAHALAVDLRVDVGDWWSAVAMHRVALPALPDTFVRVPIAFAGLVVWSIWLYRFVLSRRACPIVSDYRAPTSVVVPSYREDPGILLDCLDTWLEQGPDEVIIVLDVADTVAYERLLQRGDPRVRPVLFQHAGKRSALGAGIRLARHELLVLVDSDTRWLPGLLEAVQMPFADPDVGGVSTRQNVYQRETSVWRRIADWLVNLRYLDYVPAMGAAGAVACVSGRTGVYRRSVVMPVLTHLEDEFFLGRRCISGDDGRLTWLVLASGYKTVHQSSARALSMFPDTLRAFMKQRVRWSRNSYRCYFTAIYKGWLWRVPFITKITVLQILLTPLTMAITVGYLVFSRMAWELAAMLLAIAWLLLGRAIRGISHLRSHPRELLFLPLVALVVILIALPLKLYALVTMNKQGWLTRSAGTVGGEGQTAASLVDDYAGVDAGQEDEGPGAAAAPPRAPAGVGGLAGRRPRTHEATRSESLTAPSIHEVTSR